MSVTQTVEIPASHRLTIDVPPEIPAGRAILTFTVAEAEPEYGTKTTANLDAALEKIWGLCKDSPLTVDSFLDMRRKDNELEESQYRRFFTGSGN